MLKGLTDRYKRTWWGVFAVYASVFTISYGGIWYYLIDPLSIPDQLTFGEYSVDRRVLHIGIAVFVASHICILISMVVQRANAKQILQLENEIKQFKDKSNVREIGTHEQILTKMVTSSGKPQPLFVSIGTGDFLAPWLTRLYEGGGILDQGKLRHPEIEKLVIRRLPNALVDDLEKLGLLEKGFRAQMESNLKLLRDHQGLKRANVTVEEREWKHFPPFHGFLYGNHLLTAPWVFNEYGRLHVRTRMQERIIPHRSKEKISEIEQFKA